MKKMMFVFIFLLAAPSAGICWYAESQEDYDRKREIQELRHETELQEMQNENRRSFEQDNLQYQIDMLRYEIRSKQIKDAQQKAIDEIIKERER